MTSKEVTKSFSSNDFSLKQLAKEIVWICHNWRAQQEKWADFHPCSFSQR